MANYSYTGSVRDLLEVEISAEGTLGLQLKKKRLSTGLQTLAVSGLLKASFGRTPAAAAVEALDAKRFKVAAQNAWVEYTLQDPTHHYDSDTGAFTGEVSAEMLEDLDVPWVILGHSERRTLMGEDNVTVGKKVAHARYHGLSVIVCVGESLEERESGETLDVIFAQLRAVADEIDDREHSSWGSQVVIAYEPIWAIGTGKVATPEQAQETHAAIRKWIAKECGQGVADAIRIQYGGSANAKNAPDLSAQPDIDGFLVGGASLKPEFADIVKAISAA